MSICRFIIPFLMLGLAAGPVQADLGDSGNRRDSPLRAINQLIEDGKYEQAIEKLDSAIAGDEKNADLLNLAAYSHRQLKRYEIALNYYLKALQIEPDHRGANEYLGELYLHLGQLDKAEERLAVLDKECFFGCKEFKNLEKAIEEYRRQNPS